MVCGHREKYEFRTVNFPVLQHHLFIFNNNQLQKDGIRVYIYQLSLYTVLQLLFLIMWWY